MTNQSKPLTTVQQQVLTAAHARRDRMLLPLPVDMRTSGASLTRLLTSLLKLALVEERPTKRPAQGWRQTEAGEHIALRLTAAGARAATGSVLPEAPVTSADDPQPPMGKLGSVLEAIGRPDGATLEELEALTGWQPHTTRAALCRLKQRGFGFTLIKCAHRKAYQAADAGA